MHTKPISKHRYNTRNVNKNKYNPNIKMRLNREAKK